MVVAAGGVASVEVEVGVVGEVDDGGCVGGGGVLDVEAVVVGDVVDDGDGDGSGEAGVAVG